MNFKEKIRKRLESVDPKKMYSAVEVVAFEVILNTKFESVDYKVYRVINNGSLPAINMGSDKMPRWVVEGADLIAFVEKQYKLVVE